jgi:hypothetical protein
VRKKRFKKICYTIIYIESKKKKKGTTDENELDRTRNCVDGNQRLTGLKIRHRSRG